jgi:hypothetical protein
VAERATNRPQVGESTPLFKGFAVDPVQIEGRVLLASQGSLLDKEEDFLPISALLLSKHPYDNSYYYYPDEDSFRLTYTSYKKITLEQFRQITNPNLKS